jgi:hypothetical protein
VVGEWYILRMRYSPENKPGASFLTTKDDAVNTNAGFLGVARANIEVGVSPETFLLLILLQKGARPHADGDAHHDSEVCVWGTL